MPEHELPESVHLTKDEEDQMYDEQEAKNKRYKERLDSIAGQFFKIPEEEERYMSPESYKSMSGSWGELRKIINRLWSDSANERSPKLSSGVSSILHDIYEIAEIGEREFLGKAHELEISRKGHKSNQE